MLDGYRILDGRKIGQTMFMILNFIRVRAGWANEMVVHCASAFLNCGIWIAPSQNSANTSFTLWPIKKDFSPAYKRKISHNPSGQFARSL